MSHVLVTMIGTHDDLDWIYENQCHDSSSESAAEQAFGYDYLSEQRVPFFPNRQEYDAWVVRYTKSFKEKPSHIIWNESTNQAEYVEDNSPAIFWKDAHWNDYPLFTKNDKAAWLVLSDGRFNYSEILDLRGRENWITVDWDYENKRKKTIEEIDEYIKNLPDDVTFFFGDAHL